MTEQRIKNIFTALLLSLLVIFVYCRTLKYGYVNWDDPDYTYENPRPSNLSRSGLKKIFTSSYMGLYHPLTMLSFSVEKTLFGESPFVRRLDNLILHTANAALVFWFFILLGAGTGPAFWTGLLWAVNPVQTESVAWVAERKNLLYALFYLTSLIFYLRYSEKKRPADYAAALFIFLLSLFSKATAVTLPFVLVLVDSFKERAEDKRLIYEKLPFFILSCIFAALAVAVQSHTANASFKAYPHSSFVFYLKEFFIPFGLSAFYPYGEMAEAFSRTAVLDAFWLMAIFAALFWSFKKGKNLAFGFLFFTVNMFPFIFLVPAGEIMAADRYLYISGAGLAFIPAVFFAAWPGAIRNVPRFSPQRWPCSRLSGRFRPWREPGYGRAELLSGLQCLKNSLKTRQRTLIWPTPALDRI